MLIAIFTILFLGGGATAGFLDYIADSRGVAKEVLGLEYRQLPTKIEVRRVSKVLLPPCRLAVGLFSRLNRHQRNIVATQHNLSIALTARGTVGRCLGQLPGCRF
jgi:hypothetical protein